MLSLRKLVSRAIDEPFTADAKCDINERAHGRRTQRGPVLSRPFSGLIGERLFRPRSVRCLPGSEVLRVDGAGIVIIAFHGGAFTGEHGMRSGIMRTRVGMGKAVGGGDAHCGLAPACLRTF